MKPELSILIDALKEIARFSDDEDQQDEIIAFRWQVVRLAREALAQTGHDWVATSRCPECPAPGRASPSSTSGSTSTASTARRSVAS